MTDAQVGKYIRLLCLQQQNGGLSEEDMLQVCGTKDEKIWAKFDFEDGHYFNKRMSLEANKRKSYVESRRQARNKADEDNVRIYLLLDNESSNIKIGSSVNPVRRYNEITNQEFSTKGTSINRDIKLLWYSEPVLRSVEKEIHEIYVNQNISGEWFNLTIEQIEDIKTYCFEKRTSCRTENEICNKKIEISNKKEEKEIVFKSEVFEFSEKYPETMLNKFCDYWTEKSKSGKMRYEFQKTFEINRRLVTWAGRDNSIIKASPENITYKELVRRFNAGETDIWERYEHIKDNGKDMYKLK